MNNYKTAARLIYINIALSVPYDFIVSASFFETLKTNQHEILKSIKMSTDTIPAEMWEAVINQIIPFYAAFLVIILAIGTYLNHRLSKGSKKIKWLYTIWALIGIFPIIFVNDTFKPEIASQFNAPTGIDFDIICGLLQIAITCLHGIALYHLHKKVVLDETVAVE